MSLRLPWGWTLAVVLAPSLVFRTGLTSGLVNGYQLVAAALAGFIAVGFARRPELTCRLLVIVLPFQLLLTSGLYRVGVPGGWVRMGGLWKELAVLALALAVLLRDDRERRPFDALDRVGLGFVVLGTIYGLIPQLLAGDTGAAVSVDQRFVAWRVTVLPVAILLLARRLPLDRAQVDRILRTAVHVGVAVAVIGCLELAASDWWNSLLVEGFRVNDFRLNVLDVPFQALRRIDDIRVKGVGGVRAGGPMVDALGYSFVLVAAFAVALERRLREAASTSSSVLLAVLLLGLLLGQTRSVVLGGAVAVLLAILPGAGRSVRARVAVAVWFVAAGVTAVVLALGSGALERLVAGDSFSNAVHLEGLERGIDQLVGDPLGAGLGLGAGGFTRGAGVGQITTENQFLDVGVQLGVLGMVLFTVVLVLLIRYLRDASRAAPPGPAATAAAGMRLALIALVVPCFVLQPFVSPEVGWVVFLLAGIALGAPARPDPASASDARPVASRWT